MMLKRLTQLILFAAFLVLSNLDALSVNIICRSNGKGLEMDGKVLEEALAVLGCDINRYQGKEKRNIVPSDINIFCEQISFQFLPFARHNWFIPNPEIALRQHQFLDKIDLILCRTREVETIFDGLGKNTYFLGFTTPDAFESEIFKDYFSFIHVGGSSPYKGTKSLIKCWETHENLPFLVIISTLKFKHQELPNLEWIKEFLPQSKLRLLQNQCGVHLCPSETEGYGHYLVGAMSCGAVIITTNAPPMNEFIQDPRFLIPYTLKKQDNLATRYYVAAEDIEKKINQVNQMSREELQVAGMQNRALYLEMDRQFKERLKYLLTIKLEELAFPR